MRAALQTDELYRSSLDHLLTEFSRIDTFLRAQVARARALYAEDEQFRGLVISEKEVDELLVRATALPRWATEEASPTLSQIRAQQLRDRSQIDARKLASLRQGVRLRLEELSWLFDFDALDVDIMLICLAPEIDLRYERLYAYLQDDVTKKRPSVDLILNLLCPALQDKLVARQRFTTGSPLIRNRLLHLFDDPAQQPPPLLGKYVKLDNRVAGFLLDNDEPDERVLPYVDLRTPAAALEELFLPEETKRRLLSLANSYGEEDKKPIFYFEAAPGVGKQTTAEAVCGQLGLRLLIVDGERLVDAKDVDFEETARLMLREALLQGAALCWNGLDRLLADENRARLRLLAGLLEDHKGLGFLVGQRPWAPGDEHRLLAVIPVELPRPGHTERLSLWTRYLPKDMDISGVAAEPVADQFRFTAGQIRDAAATAGNLARWRDPDKPRLTTEDLRAACRQHSNQKLGTLAQKIRPRYAWDDIVLPDNRLQQLKEVLNAAKYRSVVYNDWGFGLKLSLGKGLNVLFSGPSGTGKTMAAEIIGGELGLDLYKIDLSMVVSKYIGETEKNLSRIFEEAETANAILFFDEADALFGKRSEVRDAHDRYANIEVAYLLQRIELYEGIVILASNFRKNMDEAFVRRMQFQVEFPFPDEDQRQRIWEGIWPDETPRSPDLGFEYMANRFDIAGGNIKNVALGAAFVAASDGGKVTQEHLLSAVEREYQKMGRVVRDSQSHR